MKVLLTHYKWNRALPDLVTKLFNLKDFLFFYVSFCDFLFLVNNIFHTCFSYSLFGSGFSLYLFFSIFSFWFRIFLKVVFFFIFSFLLGIFCTFAFYIFSFWFRIFLIFPFLESGSLLHLSLVPCIFFSGPWWYFSQWWYFFHSVTF